MKYPGPLVAGRLVARYQRFFADVAIGAIGLALQLSGDLQPETIAPPPPEPSRATANSEDVRTLTDDARVSARAGACADVVNLSRRVSVLDPPYYRHVFRADSDIASCL